MTNPASCVRAPGRLLRPFLTVGAASILCLAGTGTALADAPPTHPHLEDFDAARFSNPTNVRNEWFAFEPGVQWAWEGTTVDDDGEVLPHRVVVTATGLIKTIGAVPCVVSYDLDYEEDELVEAEIAFFAQDDEGNVWRMGEHPEEYDDGSIELSPTWIHGVSGSVAGITMRSRPELGGESYAEGWAPAVDFTDRCRIREFIPNDCVPLDCYDNVLVVEETSAAEPGTFQLKYWARDVGNIRVGWRGAAIDTREILELVSRTELDAASLAKVHEAAMALERSAYEVSPDVYGHTMPMTLPE